MAPGGRALPLGLAAFDGGPAEGGRSGLLAQEGICGGVRTLVQKADLLHGFDIAWRDAVLLQLRKAGLRGRWWLAAVASLSEERVRVRLGPLVGPLAVLLDFGVGQGKRAGVHLFGALVRAY